MGRRGKWFVAVKSCLTANCNAEKSQKDYKSKAKWKPGNTDQLDAIVAAKDEVGDQDGAQLPPPPPSKVDVRPLPSAEIKPPPMVLEAKLPSFREDEQSKHAYSVALASAVATEAAAEVVRLTAAARVPGKSKEEIAAIKIQTTFRGYLARKELQTSRGLERLKKLVEGSAVKQQTANTLYLMQTLSRLQSQIQARRIRMKEENQALQRQLQLKHERELEKLKIGEEWDDSMQSKEQIEARIVNKHEAAIRRERALAYAFSHQWKASSRAMTPMFTDTNNPQWGWSWLERWLSARPWENRMKNDINDHTSIKSTSQSSGVQAQRDFRYERTPVTSAQKFVRPPSRQSPSTPPSKPSSSAGRKRLVNPRGACGSAEEDSRSMTSLRSDCPRRHNITGSSVRDDDSLTSSPSVLSYMASTESARAKSRFHALHSDDTESLDAVSVGSVKKRLSFPIADKQKNTSSLATVRRHSGPPKFGSGLTKYSLYNDKMTEQGMTR